MKKSFWVVLGLVIIGAFFAWLLFGRLEESLVYFVTPTELLEKGDAAKQRQLRLGGMVKTGSLEWNSSKTELAFFITDGKKELRVLSSRMPPQMFQEGIGVVVDGKWLADGNFRADRLMVKHSNEYHPPKEGEKPSIIYKDIIE